MAQVVPLDSMDILDADTSRFKTAWRFMRRVQNWTRETEPSYKSAFDDLEKSMVNGLKQVRDTLIIKHVKRLKEANCPNVDFENADVLGKQINFFDIMREAIPEDADPGPRMAFEGDVLGKWFNTFCFDREELTRISRETIIDEAKDLTKYRASVDEILNKDTLKLRAHTMNQVSSRSSYITTAYLHGRVQALEKLIRIFVEGADPIFVKPYSSGIYTWIYTWAKERWSDEAEFYQRATPSSGPVLWWQFFKNGNLKIRLKTRELAFLVADAIAYNMEADH